MPTLHTSEQTNVRVLPQPGPLEPAPVDNPGVGTKQCVDAVAIPQTGVQHDRGETGDVLTCPPQRHLPKTDEPAEAEKGRKAQHAVPKPVAARVFVLDRYGKPLYPCHPAAARRLLASGRAQVARFTPFIIRLTDRSAAEPEIVPLEVKISPVVPPEGVPERTSGRAMSTRSSGISAASAVPSGKGKVLHPARFGLLVHDQAF